MMLALVATLAYADPKDDARRHFMAGLQHAEAKEYQLALDEFLKAQAAWPHPSTLYNIARAYSDLGNIEQALSYYRLFRDADPARAADVDPVIAVLEAQLAQAKAQEEARKKAEADALAAQNTGNPPPETLPPDPPPPEPLPPALPFLDDAYQRQVVTASRYGQDPLDSPATITVLTREDIAASSATTIPDLLRGVAGVDVMQLSAGQPDLSIRGFNRELSNKVLVLIDGRTVYQDFFGTTLWATLPISLHDIERIEIIRGPASSVYGANAVTGVINILTTPPGTGDDQLSVSAGSTDYASTSLSLTRRKGALAWRFGGGYQHVDRWSAEAYPETSQTLALTGFFDDQETAQSVLFANGRVDLTLFQRGLFSVSGGYTNGTVEFYTLGALGDYGLDFQSGHLRADFGLEPIHLRVFANRFAADAGPWLAYVGERDLNTHLETWTVDSELEYLKRFSTGAIDHSLNLGASYRYKQVAWDYLLGGGTPIQEHHFAAFFQEELSAGRFGAVASLRLDRHPLVAITDTLSPRLALLLRPAEHTALRLAGGTSFRSPSFLESYIDLDIATEAAGYYVAVEGDQQLLPERIASLELGIHDESTRVHTADVVVYGQQVTQLIDLLDLTPALEPFDQEAGAFLAGTTGFTNLDDTWTALGVEAEVIFFPIDGLDISSNLTFERIWDTSPDSTATTINQETSTWKFNLAATYRTALHLDLSGSAGYASAQVWRIRSYNDQGQLVTSEQAIPERLVLGARVTGHPTASLDLSVGAWNIGELGTDGQREHPKGQLVGGRVFGEATWHF